MQMSRLVVCALGVQFLGVSPVGAQLCMGNASFANGRFALGALGSFVDGSSRYGAVGTYGSPKSWYATATIGSTSFKGGGSDARDFAGSLGYQLPITGSGLEFCPYARMSYSKLSTGNQTTYGFGGGIGWPNRVSDDFDVIPAVGLQFNGANTDGVAYPANPGTARSLSSNFTTVWLNAGLVLNKQWSIVPGVEQSFTSGAAARFSVGVSYNFGK